MWIHGKTFLGTIIHAGPALHTGEGINLPGTLSSGNRNSIRRTITLAAATEYAFTYIYYYLTPIRSKRFPGLQGIIGSYRRLKHIAKHLHSKG